MKHHGKYNILVATKTDVCHYIDGCLSLYRRMFVKKNVATNAYQMNDMWQPYFMDISMISSWSSI
jgi:hypothetical protein